MKLLFIFLFVGCVNAGRSSHLPSQSQEQASCPRGCTCDRTNVVCRDKMFKDPTVISQVHQRSFPYLETLVLTGNKFGEMKENPFNDGGQRGIMFPVKRAPFPVHDDPWCLILSQDWGGAYGRPQNMTAPRETHRSLSLVNMTDSGITRISSETFLSMPNLEYLYMARNAIRSAGKATFKNLNRLRILNLSNALKPADKRSMTALLSLMFDSETKVSLPELQEIDLNDNQITDIDKGTFCKTSGVIRLNLRRNRLSKFEVDADCLQTLEQLDISNNNITTLTTDFWESLPKLTTLDISENPIHCDCSFQPFLEIMRQENTDFTNQGKTVCASPASMKNKNLFEWKGDLCNQGGMGLGSFFLLILVAVGALFGYRYWRGRVQRNDNFAFGYQGLDFDDENARPEFV